MYLRMNKELAIMEYGFSKKTIEWLYYNVTNRNNRRLRNQHHVVVKGTAESPKILFHGTFKECQEFCDSRKGAVAEALTLSSPTDKVLGRCRKCGFLYTEESLTSIDEEGNDLCPACGKTLTAEDAFREEV